MGVTVESKRYAVQFYPLIILKHFLIPVRPAENESIKRENITDTNIYIEKTKTLPDGFNVPIVPEVRHAVDRDLPQRWVKRGSGVMSYDRKIFIHMKLDTSPHGIRAIFADYMTRENIPFYLVESCLSHTMKNEVARAYHRDESNFFYMQRVDIMPIWYKFIFDCFYCGLSRFIEWLDKTPKNARLNNRIELLPIGLWRDIAETGCKITIKPCE